jgi:hypothetical protein
MKNIEVKVKTGEKTLNIGDNNLILDPSFYEAELGNIKNSDEKYLSLKYNNKDIDFAMDEHAKVNMFIEYQSLDKYMEVHNWTGEDDPTTITLTGNITPYISK